MTFNLGSWIDSDSEVLEPLFRALQYTFLVCLDDAGVLQAWNQAFADLFPHAIDLDNRRFNDLLTVPGDSLLALPGNRPSALPTQVLRLKHANHYFRCVTLPVEKGVLVCGERLNISEDQALNTLSQLTNEMAGMNMQLAQKHRELQSAYSEIQHISRTDPLTDLPNRRYFMERLQDTLEEATHGNPSFALVLFDLDHFKHINDRFGHDAGDRVLQYFAALLKKHGRKSDLSARFGGEEFIALLPNTTVAEARRFAERIRSELADRNLLGNDYRITVSAGVGGYAPQLSREELIKQADLALYVAKNQGRDRVEVFSSTI